MQTEPAPRRDHAGLAGGPGSYGEHGAADRSAPDDPGRLPVQSLAELGGDQACWLSRVCPDCGRLTEGRDPRQCANCGEPLPD